MAPATVTRFAAFVAVAAGCALVFGACGSDPAEPGGPGGSAGGDGGGLCPAVERCAGSGSGECLSIFPSCMGGLCCREQFGCLECNCDPQCPRERPFCQTGLCSECSANRDCPAARPCCQKEPGGGRYQCAACS